LKTLKFPDDDKELNIFNERLTAVERKFPTEGSEETYSEYVRKCAELRRNRIVEYEKIMTETEALHLCWCMSTEYEIGKPFELRLSAEERYQNRKKDWQHHDTSWCKRNVPMGDENSCNYMRCVPSCRYYPDKGRIEDDEIIKKHEEYWAEQRRKGEEMLAQKQKEHAEWIALTDEEKEQRRQQRIQEWKEREAWGMANQRGELGPINQLMPPAWWLEQYRKQKQQEQQRVL
jgi:hypothetical protein